jgi:hypothetical protein
MVSSLALVVASMLELKVFYLMLGRELSSLTLERKLP